MANKLRELMGSKTIFDRYEKGQDAQINRDSGDFVSDASSAAAPADMSDKRAKDLAAYEQELKARKPSGAPKAKKKEVNMRDHEADLNAMYGDAYK